MQRGRPAHLSFLLGFPVTLDCQLLAMDIIRDLRSDMSLGIVIDKSILAGVPGDDLGVKRSLLDSILFNLLLDRLRVMQY